jgi:transcriptional regulator with XRE-family HTH domain
MELMNASWPAQGRYTDPMGDDAGALGISRAGAEFAARRRELGISQRKLATLKVITAPALIAFEKGRAWPRERTRAMLEEAVQWPAGSLARLRAGGSVFFSALIDTGGPDAEQFPPFAGAVNVAMSAVTSVIEALPDDDDPRFTERARSVLTDLRRLESITAQAVRSSQGSAAVIKTLASIRTRYDALMTRAAATADATVGQRLYTARREANLSVAEAAAAMQTAPEVVAAAESEKPVSADDHQRIEALIATLRG